MVALVGALSLLLLLILIAAVVAGVIFGRKLATQAKADYDAQNQLVPGTQKPVGHALSHPAKADESRLHGLSPE